MPAYRTLDDLEVAGRTVLVRADLNVPMKDGAVTDTTRIDRLVPTIAELMGQGARVVLMSHFGRPKGERNLDFTLQPVADAVATAIGGPVAFAGDCVGPDAERVVTRLADGQVAVLENLRFHAGEEANDADFAARLAALGDIYINDAFSTAHRAHASTERLAQELPAAAGRLMQAELEALSSALETPTRPVAALVGGAKISTKLAVLGHLIEQVDMLIIGGGMANTFLNAKGVSIGASLCEHDMAGTARDILDRAATGGCDVLLPTDAVVAARLEEGIDTATVAVDAVPGDAMILDVGSATVAELNEKLATIATLLWNGPLGAFEVPPFDAGTTAVARRAAALTRAGSLTSVAGGGDTVAALKKADAIDDFTYVSTAGGAFLEWLEGCELPGVAALKR